MQRPWRKQFWFWAVLVLVVVTSVAALPPVRLQYHKSRLQALKEKKARLVMSGLSRTDKFWLQVTGKPVSPAALDRNIQTHEDALVKLGFLRREAFEAQREATGAVASDALAALRSECPWYHARTASDTNFVVTACPRMMERWRERALALGWKSRGNI